MRYADYNPAIHTNQEAPEPCLTYGWNTYYKTHKVTPNRVDVGQDLFDAFAKNLVASIREVEGEAEAEPVRTLLFKTVKMHSTGQPGWDFTFSKEAK